MKTRATKLRAVTILVLSLAFVAAGIALWLCGSHGMRGEVPGVLLRAFDARTRLGNIQIRGDWAAWVEAERVPSRSHAIPYHYRIVRALLSDHSLEVLYQTGETIPQFFRRPLIHLESDGRVSVKHWGLDDTGAREIYIPGYPAAQASEFPEAEFRRMEEEGTDPRLAESLPEGLAKVFANDWPRLFDVVHVCHPYVYLSGHRSLLYRYEPDTRELRAMGIAVPERAYYSCHHALIVAERRMYYAILPDVVPLSKEQEDGIWHTREIDRAVRAAEGDLDDGVNAKWSHLLPDSINNMYQKCGYRSIPIYAQILDHGKVNAVRRTAANQLCILGDPRCLPPLIRKLESDDDWVAADCVSWLEMVPEKPMGEAVRSLLAHPVHYMRGVHILARTADVDAIPDLKRLLEKDRSAGWEREIRTAIDAIQKNERDRQRALAEWSEWSSRHGCSSLPPDDSSREGETI